MGKWRTIELTGNTFDLQSCQKIASALEYCSNLKHFLCDDVFTARLQNSIHPSLNHMANALVNTELTVLDWSDNAVNPNGAIMISPLLSVCQSLKELYLNNTGVGTSGGMTIGESLSKACDLA